MAAPLLSMFMWIFCMIFTMAFVLYYLACADDLFKIKQLKMLLYFTSSGIMLTLQLLAVIYASAHIHIVNKADLQLSELRQSTKECGDEYTQVNYERVGKVLSKSRTFGAVGLGFSLFHICVELVLMILNICLIFKKRRSKKAKKIKEAVAFTV